MTMYSPSHYDENREDEILDCLRRYTFATLITIEDQTPTISHLPLLLEIEEGQKFLLGHCARPNSQWKHFAADKPVTAIFHGPHAYISPAWYKPKPDNVPTWNHVSVHVTGVAKIVTDPAQAYVGMQNLVKHFEDHYQTGWELPNPTNEGLLTLMRGIVVFRIEIQDIQAKFKLSQKQDASDRANVIDQLKQFGDIGREVSEWMLKTPGKTS